MYVRKTRDEWQILSNYGYGWEEVTAASTRAEAKALLKDYRDNQPQPCKVVKRRVKIT